MGLLFHISVTIVERCALLFVNACVETATESLSVQVDARIVLLWFLSFALLSRVAFLSYGEVIIWARWSTTTPSTGNGLGLLLLREPWPPSGDCGNQLLDGCASGHGDLGIRGGVFGACGDEDSGNDMTYRRLQGFFLE